MMEQVAPDFAKRFPMVIRLESDREFRPQDETVSYLEREVDLRGRTRSPPGQDRGDHDKGRALSTPQGQADLSACGSEIARG